MSYDPRGLVQSCAGGDGSRTIVVFGYAARPDVALWLDLTSCPTLSNGHILAWTAGMPGSYPGITALGSAVLAAK